MVTEKAEHAHNKADEFSQPKLCRMLQNMHIAAHGRSHKNSAMCGRGKSTEKHILDVNRDEKANINGNVLRKHLP